MWINDRGEKFGTELILEGVLDLRDVLGVKRYGVFFRDNMGAVEFKVNGTKELFIPGSESDYGLKAMVLFFE